MNTQTLILAILQFGEATGYEIKKQSTEGAFSYFVDISFGSIYPALSRLEALGFVTARTELQDGKPDKKIYSITESGRQEFRDTLKQPVLADKFKSEFLLVAMCAELTSKQAIADAINKQLNDIEQTLQVFTDVSGDFLTEECCESGGTKWIIEYGRHVKSAAKEFIENNRERLIDLASDEATYKQAAE